MKFVIKDSNNNNYNLYIQNYTKKLGNISNFSVKKGVDAYCNKNCNKCYCDYMQMFGNHVMQVESNFKAIDDSKNDSVLYFNIVETISHYIKLNGCNVFRFNVEGDINKNYLNIIIDVAKNNADCIVYLYTKNYDIIDSKLHDIVNISNLIILLSIMNYNDSYIINKYLKYDNVKFFITTRNEKERLLYYKTYYHFYFKNCRNDSDDNIKCNGCRLCFTDETQFIFNQYRKIKKVNKKTIPYVNLFLTTCNRFQENNFLTNALKEALTAIFCNTTATKKELLNLGKLTDIQIRSFSRNAKKQYGQCAKYNNDYYKITINNMNYYKTICILIHELIHVLVFDDGHGGRFDKLAREIEENTVFLCRGAKIKLNDINYKNSIALEAKLVKLTRYMCTTLCMNSSYEYFNSHTRNQLIMEYSNNIVHYFNQLDADDQDFQGLTNLRSIVTKTVIDTLKNEYSRILDNINN